MIGMANEEGAALVVTLLDLVSRMTISSFGGSLAVTKAVMRFAAAEEDGAFVGGFAVLAGANPERNNDK